MKRLLLTLSATALLVAPFRAQGQSAQTSNDITIPEFRQALIDLTTYLDAHKGTDLRRQMEAAPTDILEKLYPAVPNPRRFQSAVTTLKQHDAEPAGLPLTSTANLKSPEKPLVVAPACGPPDSIIDDSAGAQCTPAYPDPTNGSWQALVNSLITVGAFSGASGAPPFQQSTYDTVSPQGCGLGTETGLSVAASTLQGTVLAATAICGILIPPAQQICWAVDAAFSLADATSFGLYQDCVEQDGQVNSAKIDAAFHNTVTIYDALGGLGNNITTVINNLSTVSSNLTTIGTNVSNTETNVNTLTSNLNTLGTTLTTQIGTVDTDVDARITNLANSLTTTGNALSLQLTNTDSDIDTRIGNLSTAITNLNNNLNTLVAALGSQIGSQGNLLDALLRQIMKLQLTPQGQEVIDPPILTCTGAPAGSPGACPNVLALCPNGKCSWNNVGPLP